MKHLILAASLAMAALSGCAQLKEWSQDADAPAGATAGEEHSPFPTRYRNPGHIPQ